VGAGDRLWEHVRLEAVGEGPSSPESSEAGAAPF
jgi:hypothetical protein